MHALTFPEDLLSCFALQTLLWSSLIPWNLPEHQALLIHILDSDCPCSYKSLNPLMSVKARIAVNQTLLWTTQKMKKDAVPCGGGGSQVKRAVVHWQSWGVVLSPPLEGRAGCLGGAYGTGAGLFGTTALLLSTTAFGTAVCRMALCWQGVNCKALTRSVSLDRALWPPPLGGIVASGGGLEQVLQQYSFVSCRRRPAHRPVKYKIQKLFCQFPGVG